MIDRRFRPGFTCDLQLMTALVAQGYGGLDNGALPRLVEQLSGRTQEGRT
jgi:hypothetical protein